MTAKEQLLQEIQHSPELLIQEVLDFLLFARSRNYNFAEPKVVNKQQPHQSIEIDWSAKWEQWFTECESVSIPNSNQQSTNEYTNLLINKYRKQGLEL